MNLDGAMQKIDLHITIMGQCFIKKNTSKTSMYMKDKFGRKIPRDQPIHYYTTEYKDWARNAIQTCMVYKTKHPEIKFPIVEEVNVKCLFYMQNNRVVDLSNLFAGIHDVLTANEKWANVPAELYQILWDDSTRYIKSVDGSRALLDMIQPRCEVFITNYKM